MTKEEIFKERDRLSQEYQMDHSECVYLNFQSGFDEGYRLGLEEMKEYFIDAMGQGCGQYNREKEIMEYDHMCLSAWESMVDYALENGWITKDQVLR